MPIATGDFERGWRSYEWRWRAGEQRDAVRDFRQPLWLGGQSIAGKTILLHAEQGLGDTIQFCRYAGLVADRAATVLLEVQPPLKALLSRLGGVNRLLARGEPLPDFDFHCPLLSMPLAFNTTLETVPAELPYLASDPLRASRTARSAGRTSLRAGSMNRPTA